MVINYVGLIVLVSLDIVNYYLCWVGVVPLAKVLLSTTKCLFKDSVGSDMILLFNLTKHLHDNKIQEKLHLLVTNH